MKTIKLQNNKGFVIVDDEDYDRVSQFKWYLLKKSNTSYAIRAKSHGDPQRLHRFIMKAKKGQVVDHRDGHGWDCRRSNLRICTTTQNLGNSRKRRKQTASKYKGVSPDALGTWQVQCKGKVWANCRSEKRAAEIYDQKARVFYGEFAAVNFPKEGERCCLRQ